MFLTQQDLPQLALSSIRIRFEGVAQSGIAASRFGGQPDVPPEFLWPMCHGTPMAFLVQISCADVAAFDRDGLLPKTGVLSFFYDMANEAWLHEDSAFQGARVFWFEDASQLAPAAFPAELGEKFRYPAIGAQFSEEQTLPCWEDLTLGTVQDYEEEARYTRLCEAFGCCTPRNASRMLGWYDPVQNTCLRDNELALRGMSSADWRDMTKPERTELLKSAFSRWQTLLQLDWIRCGDFTFMIADSGRLYFSIPGEDLAHRCFDRVCVTMQCY